MEAPPPVAVAPSDFMTFVVVFASKHTTFRLPELCALAHLNGVRDLKYIYEDDEQELVAGKLERYGLGREQPSPISESGAVADAAPLSVHSKQDYEQANPFMTVFLPSIGVAERIASRSVSMKEVIELWGCGPTYEAALAECFKNITQLRDPYFTAERSFKISVKRYGHTLPKEDMQQVLDRLKVLNLAGRVQLDKPDNDLVVYEYWGRFTKGLKMIYIGRFVRVSLSVASHWFPFIYTSTTQIAEGSRSRIDKLSLKKRAYLGTTSMDAELSLLMANQALAAPGTLILDPFVGTGSLLCSSAEFGSMVMGGDIDPRVLRGTDKEHSVLANMQQYNFMPRFLDLVVHDQASCAMRATPFLDAIIADPPYGIRAGARKIGMKEKTKERRSQPGAIPISQLATPHIPQTLPYDVPAVLTDLLSFSARCLVLGGRLVYWLPTTNEYKDEDLPMHPCLRLEANSEQIFTWQWRRRLITMVKCMEYDEKIHKDVRVYYNPAALAHANLAEKILKGEEDPQARLEKRKRKEANRKKLEEKKAAKEAAKAAKANSPTT